MSMDFQWGVGANRRVWIVPTRREQFDRLIQAVRNVVAIEPAVLSQYEQPRKQRWFSCLYCAARSIRQPLQHRAGCVWAELKASYEDMAQTAVEVLNESLRAQDRDG